MTELETDIVLSAIRRGEDSLPRLRAATGLEYAKLQKTVYELEYEWRSIDRSETADGFSRFVPKASEKSNGNGSAPSKVQVVPPSAEVQRISGNRARSISLIQRDAPYCAQCRALCLFDGLEVDGRVHWRCKFCASTFEGSSVPVMTPEPDKPESADMRERVPLGTEEEVALDHMRGRQGESPNKATRLCGCGRPDNHGGRCSFRRRTSPSLADELSAQKKETGRPRVVVDLNKLEDAIANPSLSMTEVADHAGIKRNVIYDRKDVDPEFRAAYDRGMDRREQAIRSQISEDVITKPITSNGKRTEVARFASSDEEPKHAIANSSLQSEVKSEPPQPVRAEDLQGKVSKPVQIMQEIMQPMAQVQVMGGLKLHEQVEVRVSEIAQWPADRITEFFEALAKVIEIPHRPLPTKIEPAWSPGFEKEVGDPEGSVGLSLFYLISMLHHRMETHEKEAVWTLVQYLKRMECAVEERKEQNAARTTIK